MSSDTDTTNSCLSDSPMEEGSKEKWAALSSVSLEQFDDGMEYIVSELQEEVVEKYSLVMSTEEFQLPPQGHFVPPSPHDRTIVACKCQALPKGHASTGIVGLCIDGCHIGDWNEEPVIACLDSGSDLMLLSEAALAHLKKPPHIHSVKGFQLKGVTGEVRDKGYINLRLWLQGEDGVWVEFLEEAWVLKDLKVPLLLGGDFHVNYHLSTV